MESQRDQPTPDRRLNSWKEIAAFFDRDERTVKRWEKERALPVHRLPGSGRAGVFAYTDELSDWLKGANVASSLSTEPNPVSLPGRNEFSGTQVGSSDFNATPHRPSAIPFPVPRSPRPVVTRTTLLLAALACVVALAALVFKLESRGSMRPNADGLEKSMTPGSTPGGQNLTAHRAASPEAEDLYLKGRYYWNKRTPESLNQALDYFTQAIAHDPNYAQAYAGLADCYNLLREYTAMPPDEAFPRALAAARKAVALDDTLADAHKSLAFASFYWNWDAAGGEHEFKRALELDPNSAVTHHWYATFLLTLGRFQEAGEEIEQARKLDPASAPVLADKGLILFYLGQRDQAVAQLKQIEDSEPAFISPRRYLAFISLVEKDYPDYLVESTEVARLSHDAQALAIAAAGEQGLSAAGAHGMLESMLATEQKLFTQGQFPAYPVAQTCSLLGDKQQALHYLHSAYDKRETFVLALHIDPTFAGLHNEPAYQQLVARSGFPSQN